MSKPLAVLISFLIAGHAFAQGIVNVSASTVQNRPLRYTPDNGVTFINIPAGSPAQIPGYGQINITAYAASVGTPLPFRFDGTPDLTGWHMAGQIDRTVAPSAGNMPTFGFTLDASLGAPGTPVQFTIVGWTGVFADFESAFNGGAILGWAGSPFSGGALSWNQPTGTPVAPVVVTFGANGFNGLVIVVTPEPGPIALGGLGVAALLLFRRRK